MPTDTACEESVGCFIILWCMYLMNSHKPVESLSTTMVSTLKQWCKRNRDVCDAVNHAGVGSTVRVPPTCYAERCAILRIFLGIAESSLHHTYVVES